jgi:hypothetical protein
MNFTKVLFLEMFNFNFFYLFSFFYFWKCRNICCTNLILNWDGNLFLSNNFFFVFCINFHTIIKNVIYIVNTYSIFCFSDKDSIVRCIIPEVRLCPSKNKIITYIWLYRELWFRDRIFQFPDYFSINGIITTLYLGKVSFINY